VPGSSWRGSDGEYPDWPWPAASTAAEVLKRHGLAQVAANLGEATKLFEANRQLLAEVLEDSHQLVHSLLDIA
jgi:hypothetical protein